MSASELVSTDRSPDSGWLSWSNWRRWEKWLAANAVIIFAFSAMAYWGGMSLRKWVLGWRDETAGQKIGLLKSKSGLIRRQLNTEMEFQSIDPDAELYNYDTIMTNTDGAATLVMDDRSTLELGPNTMIRLVRETEAGVLSAQGVMIVDVIAGTARASSPNAGVLLKTLYKTIEVKPSSGLASVDMPSPVAKNLSEGASATKEISPPEDNFVNIRPLTPMDGTEIQIEPGSTVMEKTVTLEWQVAPPKTPVEVRMWRKQDGTEVFHQTISSPTNLGQASIILDTPGDYEWDMQAKDNQAVITSPVSRFTLLRDFQGIDVLPPLLGGKSVKSNSYLGEGVFESEVTLMWKPVRGAKEYNLVFNETETGQRVQKEIKIQGTRYDFRTQRIFKEPIFYSVNTLSSTGFNITSAPQAFRFSYLPPGLGTPNDRAYFSKSKYKRGRGSLLFTWEKMSFTDDYEIEIASDSEFKELVAHDRLKTNFYSAPLPKEGEYWWRVRCLQQDIMSEMSKPRRFKVTP